MTWNGSDEPAGRNLMAEQRPTLTKRGMIAAICLAAEPYVVPGCPVTVYDAIPPRHHTRGEITYVARPCGEHVSSGGLCRKHAAERERLV